MSLNKLYSSQNNNNKDLSDSFKYDRKVIGHNSKTLIFIV